MIGDFFYAMGFQTEYRLVLLGRMIKEISKFLWKTVFKHVLAALRFVWREIVIVWRELFRPFYVFGRGIYRVFAHGAKVTKERNVFFGFFSSVAYLFRGLFRYVHVIPGMISYVLPFIAAAGLVLVVQNALAEEYTLEVKVNGETIGYVENEMVFENAKDDVQERVEYAATNASTWDISPTYTLSTKTATLTEIEMADAILMASSEEISEGTAVYIDGELCLITDEGDELQAYLDSLTAPFEEDDDPTMVVSFNKEIELVAGIYFTETFTSVDEIIAYFSGLEAAQINYTVVSGDSWSLIASKNGLTQAEIFAMNPGLSTDSSLFPGDQIIIGLEKAVLEVLIYRTIEYDESIAYSTTKTESNDYNFGTTQVTQYGVDGVRHITAEVMYDAAGNVLQSEILTSEVTLEPVTQIEVVGTYLSSGMIAKVGTGTLIWPVPNYTYVSRWASSSHDGVDICGPAGTAIYAADAGVVIKAGYNAAGTGYGYSIVIDHGNGYQTLYAHGLSVAVSVGDVVTQGQYIMPMGSTGYSTGNHLHFEIEYNGSLIWPQSIF
ncbi:MAG: M23 family metallopeptidase [Faecalibacterium sp.]